jgi:8-oxo-dGTP diphosphatase
VTVRAAGGVVRRDGELLVIHRPKYDDWSFPKGKLDEGESWEDAALREVEEETGFRCSLGAEVGSTSYIDSHGRPKIARYWLMRPEDGEFAPTDEVDEIAWLSPTEAAERLSYERDRLLLEEAGL